MALAGVIALGAGLYFGGFADRGNVTNLRGKEAGALFGVALPDAKGREQSIGQWKGKVLVVNFWATWCVPCREEMPEFVKAQQEFGPRGLQFVGIAIDDVPKVEAFAAELGLNYPVLIGGLWRHRAVAHLWQSSRRPSVHHHRRPCRAHQPYPTWTDQGRTT